MFNPFRIFKRIGLSYVVLPALFISSFFFSACTVSQDVYLQEIDVRGPVYQPPVFITDSAEVGEFRIAPLLSFGKAGTLDGTVDGHTKVNRNGVYQLDTTYNGNEITLQETPDTNTFTYQGKNLRWQTPEMVVGVQGDYAISRTLALAFGFRYSALRNQDFWSGNVGLGLHTTGEMVGFRLEGGVHWSPLAYDALTVVVTRISLFGSTTEDVAVFHDIGRETNLGFYGSLTLNTRRAEWPLNLFLNVALARQRVTNYEPHTSVFVAPFYTSVRITDVRASASATFLSVSPGVYLNFDLRQRLILGVRWTKGTDVVEGNFLSPFIQYEIVL